jgi:hypothetical protein
MKTSSGSESVRIVRHLSSLPPRARNPHRRPLRQADHGIGVIAYYRDGGTRARVHRRAPHRIVPSPATAEDAQVPVAVASSAMSAVRAVCGEKENRDMPEWIHVKEERVGMAWTATSDLVQGSLWRARRRRQGQ